ncbi:MAG: hypothetical protein R2787_02625 [Saprospiraceae bacterium]
MEDIPLRFGAFARTNARPKYSEAQGPRKINKALRNSGLDRHYVTQGNVAVEWKFYDRGETYAEAERGHEEIQNFSASSQIISRK